MKGKEGKRRRIFHSHPPIPLILFTLKMRGKGGEEKILVVLPSLFLHLLS